MGFDSSCGGNGHGQIDAFVALQFVPIYFVTIISCTVWLPLCMMSKLIGESLIGGVIEGGKGNWDFFFRVYLRLSQCLLDWGLLIISIESLLLVVGSAWENLCYPYPTNWWVSRLFYCKFNSQFLCMQIMGGKEKMLSSYGVIMICDEVTT